VQISLGGVTAEAITRPDGSFDVELAAAAGPVEVALTYAGGDGIDAARTEPATVDPSKATVDMTVSTSVTPEGVLVTVVTTADGAALSVPVTLRITATDKDEPHKDVATRSGQPTLIRRVDALGAGSRRITARFAGDTGHAAATTAVVVELASDTTTTVTAPASAAYDATIRLRGRVVDADGVGVAKVTVTAAGEGKRRVGSATTGADGTFRIDVEASLLGTGRHGLVLSAEPREAWLRASQSPVVIVTVGSPRPAPVAITIAAFAATVLTALGFVWARRRREQRAPAAPDATLVDAAPRGGLDAARPSLVSTLRRASDHGFAGAVRDSVRTRPLAEATIALTLGADARTVGHQRRRPVRPRGPRGRRVVGAGQRQRPRQRALHRLDPAPRRAARRPDRPGAGPRARLRDLPHRRPAPPCRAPSCGASGRRARSSTTSAPPDRARPWRR
jgi:hypothetical protein